MALVGSLQKGQIISVFANGRIEFSFYFILLAHFIYFKFEVKNYDKYFLGIVKWLEGRG